MYPILGVISGYVMAEGEKADYVRLLDVILIGPLMIMAGIETRSRMLQIAGGATITYNLINYLKSKGA